MLQKYNFGLIVPGSEGWGQECCDAGAPSPVHPSITSTQISHCKVLCVCKASVAYMASPVPWILSFKVNVSAALVFTTQNLILEQCSREILR